jgi:multidrug efflux system outer membrane protein
MPALLVCSGLLAGCTLAPHYERPALAVNPVLPGTPTRTTTATQPLHWRQVYLEPRLQRVIQRSLDNNRDLRVALLNIEKTRAQYDVQRANLLPSINATANEAYSHTPAPLSQTGAALITQSYSASLGATAYELDLFGRVRSLNKAALETFLSKKENARAVEISLMGEVATGWLTMAADQDLLRLAKQTLESRQSTYDLTEQSHALGSGSQADVQNAEILVEQARGDVAKYAAQVNQDRDALVLLAGSDLPDDDLPQGLPSSVAISETLPAGLPSEVLTRRPDVAASEHDLESQNANIGAARAAFFPSISLTGSTGSSSTDLDGLFKAHSGSWSFTPSITLPIFDGGANSANLKSEMAGRDIAVATYQKTVQTAFKEVSDALATQATLDDRLQAQIRGTAAAERNLSISRARYKNGVDSYLNLLDAQRTLYSSQQSLISLKLLESTTRVTLYDALGGDAS